MYKWDEIITPIGNLQILCSQNEIFSIHLASSPVFQKIFSRYPFQKGENQLSSKTKENLNDYFNGKRSVFSLPLKFHGTSFQIDVWKQLQSVPFGKTISYQDLSLKMGSLKKSRTVGLANGKNPFLIVVPCHRIIQKNGELGGYSAGIDKKKYLLQLETLIVQ